jgi:acylglycerol lipase
MSSTARPVPHPDYGTELVRDWEPDGAPRAVIVLVHGAFEHSGRYEHVGSQMADAGFHVRSFDLIGGGATGGRRWDTADWEDFHDQLQTHMEWALEQGPPVVLMGHSTGGTIALGYTTEDRPKPKLLVLSSPLIEARRTWQEAMIPIMVKIAPRMHIPSPVKKEDLSRDPAVGEAYMNDPLVFTVATPRFGKAMGEEMKRVQSAWDRLDVPTLVFHGGLDSIVPERGSAPMADLPTVERRLYPNLRHETMNEPEGPEVIADVIAWINKHL